MSEMFSVQPEALRTAAVGARAVSDDLDPPNEDMLNATRAAQLGMPGFASAVNLAGIAQSWRDQIQYVAVNYTQVAAVLDANAAEYERVDRERAAALQMSGSGPTASTPAG
ncbi:ESX-1 secretion-associated protein [Streptomycetaceae bacterium NBC_01309]